jgi:hypothetical protein
MISISQAVDYAKRFLADAGIGTLWCTLEEATLTENRWIVRFDYKFLGTHHRFTVELNATDGSIITYRREILQE